MPIIVFSGLDDNVFFWGLDIAIFSSDLQPTVLFFTVGNEGLKTRLQNALSPRTKLFEFAEGASH